MTSVYDIAFSFVETLVSKKLYVGDSQILYIEAISTFIRMLDSNWTSEQLMTEIHKISTPINSVVNLDRLFKNKNSNTENMIKQNEFYYHNMLRSLPAPPKTEWNIDTGEITTINEEYFLEMRASITLEQIVEYYCKAFDITLDQASINRYKGSMKYMIQKLNIDLVMFMIDAASDIITTSDLPKPASPVAIGEYESQARESYFAKVSENTVSGDDIIVFKSRILPSGTGWEKEEQKFSEEQFNYS